MTTCEMARCARAEEVAQAENGNAAFLAAVKRERSAFFECFDRRARVALYGTDQPTGSHVAPE